MHVSTAHRRLAARLALAAIVIAGLWSLVLLFHGGFDTRLLGVRIRTNDAYRPLLITFAAMWCFVAAVGEDSSDPAMSRLIDVSKGLLARVDHSFLAILLAAAVVVVGVAWGSKVAGGSDSYGYISEADLLLSGHVTVAQPWVDQVPWPDPELTFSPLAYHPGNNRTTLVPICSVGLPMLMACAKRIGGQCAIFWVVPLSGGVFVLATFALARRLAGSVVALAAAWLLATSPPLLFSLLAPMSDVPAAAAWAVAFWWVTAGTIGASVAGGLAATLAVLIRPNLVPMAGLPVLWFILEARRDKRDRRRHLWQAAGFLAALLPGILVTAALNNVWNGSPLTSGYGTVADIFSANHFLFNLWTYSVWLAQTQTPLAFLGIAALFIPAQWLWPAGVKRSTVVVLGLFVAAVWAEYCAYRTFGAWWDLRFLLPASGFMMIGLAVTLLRVARNGSRLVAVAVAMLVMLLGLRGVRVAVREHTFDQQRLEARYAAVATAVAARTDANGVIFSNLHSGSLRYYAGRMTLSYVALDPAWFERTVSWLTSRGAHPYAVLEEFEVKEFASRFPANLQPSAVFDGPMKVYFFDLAPPPGSVLRKDTTETLTDPSPHVSCARPAPSPVLAFRQIPP